MSYGDAPAVPRGRAVYSLSGRLIAIVFTMAFGVLLIASLVLYSGTISILREVDDQIIDKRLAMVADILKQPDLDVGALGHEVSEDDQGPRQMFIRIVSAHQPIAMETPGMSARMADSEFPDARNAPLGRPLRATVTKTGGATYRVTAMRLPVNGAPGHADVMVQAATDTTLDQNGLSWLRRLLAAVITAGVPITALASWLLVVRQLKPLDQISAAARSIDGETLEYRLKLDGFPRELRELGQQFNAMLGRLEQTWRDLQTYADTVAHEMRTPLNRLQLRSEIALRDGQSVDELKAGMAANVEDCERMTRLMQALLFLARVDSNQAQIDRQTLDVAHELAVIVDYFEASAAAKGVRLTADAPASLSFNADRQLFQRAVGNIVANAIAHTSKGDDIGLTCVEDRAGGKLIIAIRDSGCGIAPEHRERIFERFYRGSAIAAKVGALQHGEAATSVGSQGLGLAIAKSIATLHGGTLTVESTVGVGTTFFLALPLPAVQELRNVTRHP